jgi:hypothetical protein
VIEQCPAAKRRARCTECVRGGRAFLDRCRHLGASLVVAHTLATPNASTAVLVHCGFTRTATIADPDGGVDEDVWRWELQLS